MIAANMLDSRQRCYFVQHSLFAVRFDLRCVEVTGAPSPVLQGVAEALSGGLSGDMTGAGQFDVSATGVLAWIPAGAGLRAKVPVHR